MALVADSATVPAPQRLAAGAVGATNAVFTVAVTAVRALSQLAEVRSATKYVVVALIEGGVYASDVRPAALVRNTVPPVLAEYQMKVPAVALVADSATVPAPQRLAAGAVGATGIGLIVAVTAVRDVLSQVPLWKVTK